jgi:hypothetical protein
MIKEKVLDNYTVIRCKCEDESLYRNTELLTDLNNVFHSPRFIDSAFTIRDWNGPDGCTAQSLGSTTYTRDNSWKITELKGIEPFLNWFTEKAFEATRLYGFENPTSMKIHRAWSNKQLNGASGRVHSHREGDAPYGELYLVAVFYLQHPNDETGADLVMVRDGVNLCTVEECLPEDIHGLNVRQGELLFHEAFNVWHGITVHRNDMPRIMFAIEIIMS